VKKKPVQFKSASYFKFPTGDKATYAALANAGDKDYQALMERILENPETHYVHSVAEGLERVENSRSVLHIYEGMFSGYFK